MGTCDHVRAVTRRRKGVRVLRCGQPGAHLSTPDTAILCPEHAADHRRKGTA